MDDGKPGVARLKFCVTIGSCQLVEFVDLNIRAVRHVFGDVPILISDDWSDRTVEVRDLAERMDVHFTSGGPRGHFAGDCQTAVDGLAFAESQGSDVCIKLSQRFVLCAPAAREIIERYFSDANIDMILPGRVPASTIKRAESRFFSNLSTQSDLVCVRTGKLRPQTLKELYEARVRSGHGRHSTLIEGLFAFIMDVTLAGHVVQAPEFTNPYPGRDPIYLRRCQSEPADYMRIAQELGMSSGWVPLVQEWRQLTNSYRPSPIFL